MKKSIKLLPLMAFLLTIILSTGICAGADSYESFDDLENARIGVVTGSVQAVLVPELLPDAQYQEYNSTSDAIMALETGKIDAFPVEESVYYSMRWEGRSLARIDKAIEDISYGLLFGKGLNPALQDEFNEFLASKKENGELEKLEEKWFAAEEPLEFADYESLSGEKGTLKIAINSSQKPFAYLKDGRYAGFDIEMLTLFAKEYGYKLSVDDASFGGILTGIAVGTYDIGASGVTITDERKESVDFSDCYHTDKLIMVTRGQNTAEGSGLERFNNGTLGVIDGSIYAGYSKDLFPDAKIDSYPTFLDLFQCVKQGKIDGFMLDLPNYNAARRTETGLSYITVPDYSVEIGYAFGKDANGDKLKKQMDELLDEMRADGTLSEILDKWCGEKEPTEAPVVPEFSENAQELRIAMDLSRKPFVYLLGEDYVGFEIEVLYLFCEKYGYRPKFESAQWTAGVAGLKEGKYDVLSCGIYITEERKESVNFCEPYLVADVVMVVQEQAEQQAGFWESFKDGFEKTFIRENRWKLIAEGIGVTLIINFFAILGGTLFGFALYMLSRAQSRIVSGVTKAIARVYSRIIAGTPVLVILMILFYVIFGKLDISGIIVAIIGFILVFGSFVYGYLTLTVNRVDYGQTEAAYALGYSRNKAFFRIILPQALKSFMPTYTSEVVGLIKSTSVVGYIAVNDLTKMGDIIRSNTYEAFFPLIAVAVIYFILTWIVSELLGAAARRLDSKKRKNKSILKGVTR